MMAFALFAKIGKEGKMMLYTYDGKEITEEEADRIIVSEIRKKNTEDDIRAHLIEGKPLRE